MQSYVGVSYLADQSYFDHNPASIFKRLYLAIMFQLKISWH